LHGSIKIALAERKPQFVQVGGHCFDVAKIDSLKLYDDDGSVEVWMDSRAYFTLYPPDAAAFLSWWNGNADVVRLGEGE
jgi:hypothetical protein